MMKGSLGKGKGQVQYQRRSFCEEARLKLLNCCGEYLQSGQNLQT